MAGGVFQDWVTDTVTGAVIPGATVTVRDEVSGALSTIWSNSALTTPLANPMTADLNGFVRFYAANGLYRIEAVSGLTSATLRSVPIGDAQARDVGVASSSQLIDRAAGDARYIENAELTTRLGTAGNLGEAALYSVGASAGELITYEILLDAIGGVLGGSMASQDADNVDITGGSIVIDSLYVEGDSHFGGTLGNTVLDYSLYVPTVASAVNHLTVRGAIAGAAPSISAEGNDTNVDFLITVKGAGSLRAQAGNVSLIVGADNSANTLTNATLKAARIAVPHYLNAEEPTALLMAVCDNTESYIRFGGGTPSMNAPMFMNFFTAANTTTVSGTERMRLTQNLLIGQMTDDAVNRLQVNGGLTLSAGNTYKVNNVPVVGARRTGWAVPTGTLTRTTFATGSVTLPQLAERVAALIADLHNTAGHGLIGT